MQIKLYIIIFYLLLSFKIYATIPSQEITAYQYYFNNDPGVGIIGNGAIISVTPDSILSGTFPITIPGSLNNGLNYFYLRVKDEDGRWSIAERRTFFILPVFTSPEITAYQYYFDADPGVGVDGNGGIVPVNTDSVFNSTVAISIPGNLNNGLHFLYIRAKDNFGRWSLIERRTFYIQPLNTTQTVTGLEYYFDSDPGVGNGNSLEINATSDFQAVLPIGVPCLSPGNHYFYLRAKDEFGRWSLIARDTLTITTGISASVVSSDGPLNFCSVDSVIFSADNNPGIIYQWLLNDNPISGANSSSYIAHTGGDYSLKATCNVNTDTSNFFSVYIIPDVNPGMVSGTADLCFGHETTVGTNGDGGGSWKSSDTTISKVDSVTGFLQALGVGTANITYTINSGCGSPATSGNTIQILPCPTQLSVELFLQGFYTGSGMMDNYGSGGCLYLQGLSADPLDADTILVGIMNSLFPYEMIDEQKILLKTNGSSTLTLLPPIVSEKFYYLKIQHRNSIETWSKNPVQMLPITNYSFASAASQAFGDNEIETVDIGTFAIYSGDVNRDGAIDGSDFLDLDVFIQNGDGGYVVGDINGDGAADGADFLLLDPNIQLGVGAVLP